MRKHESIERRIEAIEQRMNEAGEDSTHYEVICGGFEEIETAGMIVHNFGGYSVLTPKDEPEQANKLQGECEELGIEG